MFKKRNSEREPQQFQFTNTHQAEGQFIISVSQRFTCSQDADPLQAACLDEGPEPHEEFKMDGYIFAQVTLLLICMYESNLFSFTFPRRQMGEIANRLQSIFLACFLPFMSLFRILNMCIFLSGLQMVFFHYVFKLLVQNSKDVWFPFTYYKQQQK